ncbi:hypothetical protein CFOL_v3_32976 [Cephalotus follicularis]|uniref:Uncharacterized protein n=1 Tax=Cephalotus follicularis TaxID=3775 RepID=A0A1Q3DAT7_CEPFO|nr:hypothetical protein CFOL_v3_32976 [Cephalotus follicularis]
MDSSSTPPNLDEYSASTTTIKFNPPLPLLRGPTLAGPHDRWESGPYVLAFKNPQSWASAYRFCQSRITHQCEEGARIGCAINASNKCKPPWWLHLIARSPPDLKDREGCEARETECCLAAAKDKCSGFAKEKCEKPFKYARIAVGEEEVWKLVGFVSVPERSEFVSLVGLDLFGFGVTNYRAYQLLASKAKVRFCLGSL